jgi:WD40 repeat protein
VLTTIVHQVGCTDGSVVVFDLPSLNIFACRHVVHTPKGAPVMEGITGITYSPTGEKLACCSSNQVIYVLDARAQVTKHHQVSPFLHIRTSSAVDHPTALTQRTDDPYPIIAKCKGHTATVETVDWSADSR